MKIGDIRILKCIPLLNSMDFQLEFGFYSTPALPRSVCCPVVALQQNPEPFAQVTLLRPPRPPLLTNFCVWCLCIFSVLLYAGIARAPPASVSSVFLRMVLLDFLGSSLSFQCRTLRFPSGRELFILWWRAVRAALCGKS